AVEDQDPALRRREVGRGPKRDAQQDQDDHPGHALKTGASPLMTTIRIDSVSRTFGAVRAVDNFSATIEEGKLFTLLGPSGCGKTTLLRMIAGFTELDAGRIWFG